MLTLSFAADIIIALCCLVIAVVLHELAHGWVAYKMGDPTAKRAGRLTLNPIKHIDVFGSIILPAIMYVIGGAMFGFAKPVPYNPHYFKDIRKGEFLVGLAGPFSNFLQALIAAMCAWLIVWNLPAVGESFSLLPWSTILYILYTFVRINLVLMFFNLLPIPPLDGSSIIAPFLSDRALEKYYRIQQYSMAILLLLFFVVPQFLHVSPVSIYLSNTALPLMKLMMP